VGEPSQMEFRPFTVTDLVPVQRLVHLTIDSSYSGVYPPRAVRFFKEFHSLDRILERNAEGEVIVVEQDGEIVATGTIVRSQGCPFRHCRLLFSPFASLFERRSQTLGAFHAGMNELCSGTARCVGRLQGDDDQGPLL